MQTEIQTAVILIRLFLFRPVLFAQKNCKVHVAAGCGSYGSYEINFQIYKTHIKPIKPQKPALIKPVKPAGLGFMIKPGFYANPDNKVFSNTYNHDNFSSGLYVCTCSLTW